MKTSTLPSSAGPASYDRAPEIIPPTSQDTARRIAAMKNYCLARADEWYADGHKAPARDFLQHAVELDSQDARLWLALGSVHYELGEFGDAGLAFVRAAEIEPDNATIFLQLGLAHQQLGQRTQAESLFHHALRLQPENMLALGLLATFLMTGNRHADARLYVERALAQQPDDIEMLLRLGVCCFRMSDATAARKCYERVLQLDPGHALAQENLDAME